MVVVQTEKKCTPEYLILDAYRFVGKFTSTKSESANCFTPILASELKENKSMCCSGSWPSHADSPMIWTYDVNTTEVSTMQSANRQPTMIRNKCNQNEKSK
jgi:hypothetical protein